jgi:methylated-DNA-[protein]-cysteine S-methyltransferase
MPAIAAHFFITTQNICLVIAPPRAVTNKASSICPFKITGRAVGQACGANWYPIVIPCHRVTASGGLGGFAHHDDETGFHLGVKRYLLRLERVPEYSKVESTQQQESMW